VVAASPGNTHRLLAHPSAAHDRPSDPVPVRQMVTSVSSMSQTRPAQLAYAVNDVDTAALRFSQRTGAGPFFIARHIELARVDHLGVPAVFDHSSAYGQWGPVMVELVQLHRVGPEPLRLAVGETPSGVHHVAWIVADSAAEGARLGAEGWPEVMAATTASGLHFSFHDARRDLGHLIELYEPTEAVRSLYALVAAAAEAWDGDGPVRELTLLVGEGAQGAGWRA